MVVSAVADCLVAKGIVNKTNLFKIISKVRDSSLSESCLVLLLVYRLRKEDFSMFI
jgi:hypothetical protein